MAMFFKWIINEYTTSKILAPWSSPLTEMEQDTNTYVSIIENFIMIPDISGFEYRKELRIEWITEMEVPYFSFGKSL